MQAKITRCPCPVSYAARWGARSVNSANYAGSRGVMALYGGQPSDLPFHLLIDNTDEDHLVSGVRCCVIGTGDIDGAHHDPSDLLIYR